LIIYNYKKKFATFFSVLQIFKPKCSFSSFCYCLQFFWIFLLFQFQFETSTKCDSSNKSVSGYKCYIKAYSRTITTLNVFVNLTETIFNAKFNYDLTYKSISNSYRSIINVTFEACSVLNGTANNPVFQWVMGNLPDLKKVLHACPPKI